MAVRAFPNAGDKFASKYRLISTLKVSGDLIIFHAVEIAFDRDVTLKIIKDTGDEETFSNFREKSQSFSKLKAPFTASVYSFGRCEGFLYLALEFVEGEDLRYFQHPHAPATVDQVINIFRQALFSLREAHENGIIHGDLQLKNIMLVPNDGTDLCIKIRDFKIVNFSETIIENQINERTDIKSLGGILVSLLKGYQEATPNMRLVVAPIPLKRILTKMLSDEDSYETVDEVLADLGSPSLLDSVGPKKVSPKKVYAIGLAFSALIVAPLSWTSMTLLSSEATEAAQNEPVVKRKMEFKKARTKALPIVAPEAIKKASRSINEALIVQNPETKMVKPATILKKQKPPVKRFVKVALDGKTENVAKVVAVKKVENDPTIPEPKAEDKPQFQPNKFSARTALPSKVTKTKVTKKKKVKVEKKSLSKKIAVPKKKSVPKKAAPLSF